MQKNKILLLINKIAKDSMFLDKDYLFRRYEIANNTEEIIQDMYNIFESDEYKKYGTVIDKFYYNVNNKKNYNYLKDNEASLMREFHEVCYSYIKDDITFPNSLLKNHSRLVTGDHGIYVECDMNDFLDNVYIKPGEEFRVGNDDVKYLWMIPTIDGLVDDTIKIYQQTRGVKYADYIPGKYYVSVYDLFDIWFRDNNPEDKLIHQIDVIQNKYPNKSKIEIREFILKHDNNIKELFDSGDLDKLNMND